MSLIIICITDLSTSNSFGQSVFAAVNRSRFIGEANCVHYHKKKSYCNIGIKDTMADVSIIN